MTNQPDDEFLHRELDTDGERPILQVAEIVAELEDMEQDELTPSYQHLDHALQHIFSNPPVPEAQVEITFSYEGYRITVEQDGDARFVKIGEPAEDRGDDSS